jgi:hypothetical protein
MDDFLERRGVDKAVIDKMLEDKVNNKIEYNKIAGRLCNAAVRKLHASRNRLGLNSAFSIM